MRARRARYHMGSIPALARNSQAENIVGVYAFYFIKLFYAK